MKLDHIGIAVKNIEERLKTWKDILGLKLKYIKQVEDQNVRVAVLDVGGVNIELLEATKKESAVEKFIGKRGEGIHHLCFEVEDIEGVLSKMKKQGIKLIDEVPRIGAAGKKIAFIHPKDIGGVLIELCQE